MPQACKALEARQLIRAVEQAQEAARHVSCYCTRYKLGEHLRLYVPRLARGE